MGLFDKFKKKDAPQQPQAQAQQQQQQQPRQNQPPQQDGSAPSFVFGVQVYGTIKDSSDMLVIGRVKGTVKVGMGVYVSALGVEDAEVLVTTVKEIQVDDKPAESATDCGALMILENAGSSDIRVGSIVHGRMASTADVHSAYVNALGDVYLGKKQLSLDENDLEKLSLTDLVEIYSLFVAYSRQNPMSDDIRPVFAARVDMLMDTLIDKLFATKEIYVIYSNSTNEPYMFSQTIKREQGYETTPPDIMFVSKQYFNVFSQHYMQGDYDMRMVGCGEDGNGLKEFLHVAFYLNGVCGIRFNSLNFAIDKSKVLPPPDYSGVKEIEIPDTNPDLVRWILLMGQMTDVESGDAKTAYGAYYNLFMSELPKAKLLIPMKVDGELPEGDANGMAEIKQDTTIGLATMKGKNGRPAVKMYTDWKRLREVYGEDWSGMIEPVAGFIDRMDCAINVTEYTKAGVYIDRETFSKANK